MESIKFKLTHTNARLPTRAHASDAGLDIYAVELAELWPGVHAKLPTGLHMAIPDGYAGIIKPRSGLAVKHSIDILAGVVDASYRGEVQVTLINHGDQKMEIKPGDRIAQLLIVPVALPEPVQVDSLDDTERGAGGFGSTGK